MLGATINKFREADNEAEAGERIAYALTLLAAFLEYRALEREAVAEELGKMLDAGVGAE